MCEHLTRRGARYYIRRRIPQDLVAHYGKQEITKALGTSDPKEAARRCRLEAVRLDLEWDAARAALAPASSHQLTAAQLAAHEQGEYEQAIFAAQDAVEQETLEERHAAAAIMEHHGLAGLLAIGGVNLGPLAGLSATAAPASIAQAAPAPSPGKRMPIADVLTLWEREKPRQQRTMDAKRAEVTRYCEMTGITFIEAVTKASARDFRDKLLAAGYTAKNVNKYLDSLRALLNFAVSEDLIPSNPANGVKANVTAGEDDDRKPFPLDVLNTIFSGPVHTSGDRPLGGAGEAAYWLPLLGLFTGARLEELGQLHPDDVHEESTPDKSLTAWVIRITDGEGQRLKNKSSRRRVPVHQTLLDLGFIEYVKAAKAEKRRRQHPRGCA